MQPTTESSLEFDVLDMPALKRAKKNCSAKLIVAQTFYEKTIVLSEQYNRIHDINSTLKDADVYLPAAAQRITIDLATKIKTITYFQNELSEATDETDREEILEELALDLRKATTKTRASTKELSAYRQSLSVSLDRSPLLRHLEKCEADTTRLSDEITQHTAQKELLEGERTTLTSAIDALLAQDLSEKSKEATLDPASLAALGLTAPPLAAAKAALELLQKAMQELNAALNFLGLIALRDSLSTRIGRVLSTISDKTKELGLVQPRINLTNAIQDFDDERTAYVGEFSKVVASLDLFLTETTSIAKDDVTGEQFVKYANAVVDYLKPVQ